MATIRIHILHRLVLSVLAGALGASVSMMPIQANANDDSTSPGRSSSELVAPAPAEQEEQGHSPPKLHGNISAPDVTCLLSKNSWIGCYKGLTVQPRWYEPSLGLRSAPSFFEFRTLGHPPSTYTLK